MLIEGPDCHLVVCWITVLIEHGENPMAQPDLLAHEKRQVVSHAERCQLCRRRLHRSGREDVLDILHYRLAQQG